MNEKVTMLSSL